MLWVIGEEIVPKFKIIVENYMNQWEEEYDKPVPDARDWATKTIERYNNSLYPGDLPRRLIDVIVTDEVSEAHKWEKTNLVTVMGKGGFSYDTARCERCGITAKRLGLGDYLIDPKYRKKHKKCNAYLERMEKE